MTGMKTPFISLSQLESSAGATPLSPGTRPAGHTRNGRRLPDYQVLEGTNRHTITATGWLQEENNLKLVLGANGQADPAQPYRAREYGVARYSRMRGGDFHAADEYYQRTRVIQEPV